MKKKLVLSLAAAAMVGTLAVGGTLAWFTDTETATNVVTTGHVDISVIEKDKADKEYTVQDDAGLKLDGKYVSNATVDKFVKVQNNKGSNKAWIRVAIDLPEKMQGAELILDSNKWTFNEGYYYYADPVEAGAMTDALITGVKLPNWGNDMTDQGLNDGLDIIVNAEAVQFDDRGVDNCVDAFVDVEAESYVPKSTVPATSEAAE